MTKDGKCERGWQKTEEGYIEGVLSAGKRNIQICSLFVLLSEAQRLNCEAACVFLPDMDGEEKRVLNGLCRTIALFILKHFIHFTQLVLLEHLQQAAIIPPNPPH